MRRLLGAGHTAEAQVFVLHEVPSFLPPNLSLAKDGAAKGGQLTDLAERCSLVGDQEKNCLFTEWILLYKAEAKDRSKLCCLKLH